MTKQELLDLLTAERFAPRPERPAYRPVSQEEAERNRESLDEGDVIHLHERRSA